jgi:hypothetical protein
MPIAKIDNPVFSDHWKAIMWAMDHGNMKCKFCGKQYYLWCWAESHLENKHPLQFARLLEGGDGYTVALKERLIRSTIKLT